MVVTVRNKVRKKTYLVMNIISDIMNIIIIIIAITFDNENNNHDIDYSYGHYINDY